MSCRLGRSVLSGRSFFLITWVRWHSHQGKASMFRHIPYRTGHLYQERAAYVIDGALSADGERVEAGKMLVFMFQALRNGSNKRNGTGVNTVSL